MVDVLFFCEGTYPYVSGGVSSWIHQLITGMPDLTFGILYLATSETAERQMKYTMPSNVTEFVEFYLYDFVDFPRVSDGNKSQGWDQLEPFLRNLFRGEGDGFGPAYEAVVGRDGVPVLNYQDLTRSFQSWEVLTDIYTKNFSQASFSDFFWSWRYAHYPLYKTFSAEIPKARVYHAVTTGWCGLLGAIAARRYNRPLLLTEHGLYVNERRIEISQAKWIMVDAPKQGQLEVGLGTFKDLWINLFTGLGKVCYHEADSIYTLFEGNRNLQEQFGARRDRIRVIPNGVNVEALSNPTSRALQRDSSRFRVGFVGRIVPIKDLKTLIKAARIVTQQVPDVEFYLCGPFDEDKEYHAECLTLVDALGLEGVLHFTGPVDVRSYYPCFDVQVMTSISEGQPLVILEGFCSGLPCIASDVGACRELIEGRTGEDKDLGPAGIVTKVGNPRQTAEAILALYRDPGLRARMSAAGKERVQRYYDQRELLAEYKSIYRAAAAQSGRNPAAEGSASWRA